ncbi:DUF192 domain-containing protein [Shinella daejeonensis]|uniref:DUF192 domain-containing protein n=1 Tax=Shinella daejeonensis TaxID=659017 RepID=UPI003F5CD765
MRLALPCAAVIRLVVGLAILSFMLSVPVRADEALETQSLRIEVAKGKHHDFTVEMAITPRQRERGLMHRREMAPDRGMLFAFGETRQVLMWMRNTYLPLDMLFIGRDGRIRSIHENAKPLSEAIIDSKVPVDFVLELNAGTVRQFGIRTGNRVRNALIEQAGQTP